MTDDERTPSAGLENASRARARVLIGDSQATRIGIRVVLEGVLDVCAEADDGTQAIRDAHAHQPDICILGAGLRGNLVNVVRGVSRAAPDTKVIVLDAGEAADQALEMIRAGAVGYIPANLGADALRRAVLAVARNEAAVPRSLIMSLFEDIRDTESGITPRERQVLRLLRLGYTTRMIADRLDVSPVTVRRHIASITEKVGVSDRSELVPPTGEAE